jgi:hypothetical protein
VSNELIHVSPYQKAPFNPIDVGSGFPSQVLYLVFSEGLATGVLEYSIPVEVIEISILNPFSPRPNIDIHTTYLFETVLAY